MLTSFNVCRMCNTLKLTRRFKTSINFQHMKILRNTDCLVGNEEILQTVTTEEITKLILLYYQYIHHFTLAVKIIVFISSISTVPLRRYNVSQLTPSTVPSYFSSYTYIIHTKIWLPLLTNTKHMASHKTRLFFSVTLSGLY